MLIPIAPRPMILTSQGPGPILMSKDQLTSISHVGHPNDVSWKFPPPMLPPLPPIRPVRLPLPLPDFRTGPL